ncbi:MAG: dTMP kinase [Planctomycetota bacterium]|nr:MAG: dTMP kinase [Planctomycetota bacterium]
MRGRFLVLEGVDGSGKTTQARRLVQYLTDQGRRPLHLREPGGTALGEKLRRLLLEPGREEWHWSSEALLFFAARRELLTTQVAPALAAGRDVLCERFSASTLAYQGHGPDAAEFILALDALVVADRQPDQVLILDLDPLESLERAGQRGLFDSFEARGLAFLNKVREGYRRYAEARPQNTRIIDVSGLSPDAVQLRLIEALETLPT